MTPPPSPSLRQIARVAEVSAMTVSRVLRNQSGVAPDLQERVRRAAATLGYRPDPQVTKLMVHLRGRRGVGYRSTIVALTDIPSAVEPAYVHRMRERAATRATQLGFGFETMIVADLSGPRGSLAKTLNTRGCEAILLLPMTAPLAMERLLPWQEYSVVAATYSVQAPAFHRVVPHHLHNAHELCARFAERGFRRIGFVATPVHSQRVGNAFNSALAWHHQSAGAVVPPLLYTGKQLGNDEIDRWLDTARPDVVVAHLEANLARVIERSRRRGDTPPLSGAVTSLETLDGQWAGYDEQHSGIGAAAVEILAAMVARGERGLPHVPLTTMIPGAWIEGASWTPAGALP